MEYPLNVLCPRFKLDIQPKEGTRYNPLHDEANGCIASYKEQNEGIISSSDSTVDVWVVPTNEELMIIKDTYELVK